MRCSQEWPSIHNVEIYLDIEEVFVLLKPHYFCYPKEQKSLSLGTFMLAAQIQKGDIENFTGFLFSCDN
jgi:hypothetical protein